MFRGREITHPKIGRMLLERMAESLKEVASVERQPLMDGRRMSMFLSPVAIQKTRIKEEVEKVSDAKN